MKRQCVGLSVRCSAMSVLIGLSFMCGCATTNTKVQPIQYPSSAKDWHGIDSVQFVQELRLENYSQLIVEPLDTASAALPPKDENTYEPTVTTLKQADSIFLTELQRKVQDKLSVTAKQADAPAMDRTLLLRGKVAEINPGSRAARYFVGFGAGSAWVKLNGELVDAKTKDVLVKFEQRRVGAMGLFGGDYKAMLSDCIAVIARDVGNLLSAFKTQ